MFLRCLAVLLLTAGCVGATEPVTITLHECAQVAGERLELGEVAGITGPAEQAEQLAVLDLGPAPLPGQERTLSLGYVKMRLRRWGMSEDRIVFEGAGAVAVSTAVAVVGPPAGAAGADVVEPGPVAPAPITVRRGSALRLQVTCGGVTILASATTLEDATVGGMVRLRVDQTRQTTWAWLESPSCAILSR